MYRHALPPGFVLKKDKKKEEDKDTISLEEFIEVEVGVLYLAVVRVLTLQRHKLKAPLTPVTKETFAEWKKTRLEKKEAEQEALEKAKSAQRAAGKMTGMTGKDLFEFGGEIFEDEEDVEEDWDISRMLARYVSGVCGVWLTFSATRREAMGPVAMLRLLLKTMERRRQWRRRPRALPRSVFERAARCRYGA